MYVCAGVRVLPEEPFFSAICKYPTNELGTVWNRCVPRFERIGLPLVRNWVLQLTQFFRTLAENLPRPRVDGRAHARLNFLHVNLGCGLDAGMPQDLLRVLHRPVPLHVSAQRAAHHLKGHEFPWNIYFVGDGMDSPFEEVPSLTRHDFSAVPRSMSEIGSGC